MDVPSCKARHIVYYRCSEKDLDFLTSGALVKGGYFFKTTSEDLEQEAPHEYTPCP